MDFIVSTILLKCHYCINSIKHIKLRTVYVYSERIQHNILNDVPKVLLWRPGNEKPRNWQRTQKLGPNLNWGDVGCNRFKYTLSPLLKENKHVVSFNKSRYGMIRFRNTDLTWFLSAIHCLGSWDNYKHKYKLTWQELRLKYLHSLQCIYMTYTYTYLNNI